MDLSIATCRVAFACWFVDRASHCTIGPKPVSILQRVVPALVLGLSFAGPVVIARQFLFLTRRHPLTHFELYWVVHPVGYLLLCIAALCLPDMSLAFTLAYVLIMLFFLAAAVSSCFERGSNGPEAWTHSGAKVVTLLHIALVVTSLLGQL